MGRVRAAARPAAPCRDAAPARTPAGSSPAGLRARLARRLLVVLASLALLGTGGADLLPRVTGGATPGLAASAVRTPQAPASREMQSPGGSAVVRGAPLAVVPAPTGSGAGLPPGSGPLVAPHLVARPQSRPPTSPLHGAALGAPDSRGPPATAGT